MPAHDIYRDHDRKVYICRVCGQSWASTANPATDCPGLKVYYWSAWPEGLYTTTQLGQKGYKHTQPVHFAGDRNGGTLYVTVPHQYAKDWIDKHLLSALNKLLDSLMNYDGQTRRRVSEDQVFDVTILVEGDPVPGVFHA